MSTVQALADYKIIYDETTFYIFQDVCDVLEIEDPTELLGVLQTDLVPLGDEIPNSLTYVVCVTEDVVLYLLKKMGGMN